MNVEIENSADVADEFGCTPQISPNAYRHILEEMALNGSKWDIQVGDVTTLAPFAIILSESCCAKLFRMAEALSAELLAMERMLCGRPDLWPELGVPGKLIRLMTEDQPWTPTAVRIIRFDFHPTAEGWRVSEANSDVPGGLNESSGFTELVRENWTRVRTPGNPLVALGNGLEAAAGASTCIALIAAPGYLEDQQVVSGVGRELGRRGISTVRLKPEQLRWDDGNAYAVVGGRRHDFGAIYRFFQGEWTSRIDSPEWRYVFKGGKTPVCNPGSAVLTESKRLPLLWNRLDAGVSNWRRVLPETGSVWRAVLSNGRNWVCKDAYCNTGDSVISPEWSSRAAWTIGVARGALNPRRGVAQRRFRANPMETPMGHMYPCFGIYTINGMAAGIYGRISPKAVIDYSARDIAVLVRTSGHGQS